MLLYVATGHCTGSLPRYKYLVHINKNNNTVIELDNGHIKEINLSESVTHNLCWIHGMCEHRHPNHQALYFDMRVIVQRADDHTVAITRT